MEKRLEEQKKYFQERREKLMAKIECVDRDIDILSDYYSKLLKSTDTPSEKLAKVNEDLWRLRCKRIDIVDEIDRVNYILDGEPEKKVNEVRIGNIYCESDLDLESIINVIVHGIKL